MHNINVSEKRQTPRIAITASMSIPPNIVGELINLSETGLCFRLSEPLLFSQSLIAIELPTKEFIQTEFTVIWKKDIPEESQFIYGASFSSLEDECLQKLIEALRTVAAV